MPEPILMSYHRKITDSFQTVSKLDRNQIHGSNILSFDFAANQMYASEEIIYHLSCIFDLHLILETFRRKRSENFFLFPLKCSEVSQFNSTKYYN